MEGVLWFVAKAPCCGCRPTLCSAHGVETSLGYSYVYFFKEDRTLRDSDLYAYYYTSGAIIGLTPVFSSI
jgi:hypothetical protein